MNHIDLVLENIIVEDREQVLKYKEDNEDFNYHPRWNCFECGKPFYTLESYERRIATCPHCGEQYYVKIFKNGKWSQRRVRD